MRLLSSAHPMIGAPYRVDNEHRFILLGESIQGRLLFVSYMERNNVIRIISVREATLSERKAYEQK